MPSLSAELLAGVDIATLPPQPPAPALGFSVLFTYGAAPVLSYAVAMKFTHVVSPANIWAPDSDTALIDAATPLGLTIVFDMRAMTENYNSYRWRRQLDVWLASIVTRGSSQWLLIYNEGDLSAWIITNYRALILYVRSKYPAFRTMATLSWSVLTDDAMAATWIGLAHYEGTAFYSAWGGAGDTPNYYSLDFHKNYISLWAQRALSYDKGFNSRSMIWFQAFYDAAWGTNQWNYQPTRTDWAALHDYVGSISSKIDGAGFWTWSVAPSQRKRITTLSQSQALRNEVAYFNASRLLKPYLDPPLGMSLKLRTFQFTGTGVTSPLYSLAAGGPAGTSIDANTGLVTVGSTTGVATINLHDTSTLNPVRATAKLVIYSEP